MVEMKRNINIYTIYFFNDTQILNIFYWFNHWFIEDFRKKQNKTKNKKNPTHCIYDKHTRTSVSRNSEVPALPLSSKTQLLIFVVFPRLSRERILFEDKSIIEFIISSHSNIRFENIISWNNKYINRIKRRRENKY